MVWAGVCYRQRTQVHFIDGILNAQRYRDAILRPIVVPFIYIYIYAFSRRFYPKRLTLHASYSFYILSALAFPGNGTHDIGIASAMLYHLSYRKTTTITSCCSMIMHGPMLQGSVHNSWKLKTSQFLHGQHTHRTCHPLSMFGMLWIGVYDSVFQFLPISRNFTQLLKRSGPTFHRPQSTT